MTIEKVAIQAHHRLATLGWASVRVCRPREVAAEMAKLGCRVVVEIDTTGPPIAPVYGHLRLAHSPKG